MCVQTCKIGQLNSVQQLWRFANCWIFRPSEQYFQLTLTLFSVNVYILFKLKQKY